jgi:uncharacterized protein YcfJ
MSSPRRIVDLPYEQRRLVVVRSRSPISKMQKIASEHPGAVTAGGVAVGLGAAGAIAAIMATAPVAVPVAGALSIGAAMTAARNQKTIDRAAEAVKSKGTSLLVISADEATQLTFPIEVFSATFS